MSIPSISSNSIETSPFEADFVLPEDPNINVPLSIRPPLVEKVVGLGLIAIGIVGYGCEFFLIKYLVQNHRLVAPYISDTVILITVCCVFIEIILHLMVINMGGILLVKQSYLSPDTRKRYREELEQNKITLEDFIYKHGWERILTFGLHLSDDAEPLITKKHFSKFLSLAMQDLDKGFNDTFDSADRIYSLKTTLLWQFLDYNLFSREQKKGLKKEFINRLDTIPAYTLVKNWTIIQELGWKTCFSEDQQRRLDRLYEKHQNQTELYNMPIFLILRSSTNPRSWSPLAIFSDTFNLSYYLAESTLKKWDPEYTMLSENSKILLSYHSINKERLYNEIRLLDGSSNVAARVQAYYDALNVTCSNI